MVCAWVSGTYALPASSAGKAANVPKAAVASKTTAPKTVVPPKAQAPKAAATTKAKTSKVQASKAGSVTKWPNATLSACAEKQLAAVASGISGGVTAISGTRTVAKQARLLRDKLVAGGDLVKIYANDALAKEITDAWNAVSAKERAAKGLSKVTAALQAQVDAGKFISKHLAPHVADIRVESLSESKVDALTKALRAAGHDVSPSMTHYHVNISGCGK